MRLPILAILVLTASAAVLQAIPKASHQFQLDGSAKIEGLGVCEINQSRATCWDMNGKYDGYLTMKVSSSLERKYTFDVPAKLGAKNRYLIATYTPGKYSISFQSATGRILPLVGPKPAHDFIIHETPPSDRKESSVIANYSCKADSPFVELPFRKGGKVTVDKIPFEYGAFQPIERNSMMILLGMNPGQRVWEVTFAGSIPQTGDRYTDFEVYGRDGKRVQVVDVDGEPVDTKTYMDWFREVRTGGILLTNIKYSPARMMVGMRANQGAFTAQTNVNPKRISKLRITLIDMKHVEITGFPLDLKTG